MSPKDAFKDWLESREISEIKQPKILDMANNIIDDVLSK